MSQQSQQGLLLAWPRGSTVLVFLPCDSRLTFQGGEDLRGLVRVTGLSWGLWEYQTCVVV